MWMQESVRKGDLVLKKICGKINPADLLTKPRSIAEAIRLADALGYDIGIRRQRRGDAERDGDFTGFVRRMLRGADKEGNDLVDTEMWWERNMKGWWVFYRESIGSA